MESVSDCPRTRILLSLNDMTFFHFPQLHFIIKFCENFCEDLSSGSRLNKTVWEEFS